MPNPSRTINLLKWLIILFTAIVVGLFVLAFILYLRIASELPDIKSLHNVRYEVPLSIMSRDKRLIAQFGGNKRIPINIKDVPDQLIHAFLAAEDDSFFDHPGVDYKGLMRAGLQLALTGKKKQGGSTITMQVTRNFLLSSEKTFKRKLKEIILALKIEQEYPKDKILELYLNQIYMGHSAYGIMAATQTYYGKKLSELTLAEQAMIAGLPKAPSAYNPITNEARALERRNYVLQRMLELNYIDKKDFDSASKQPSTAKLQYHSSDISAPFVAEMVRQYIYEKHGEKAYRLGLKVTTTIDSKLQETANKALRHALHIYDERHGFRLPKQGETSSKILATPVVGDTYSATVTKVGTAGIEAKMYNGTPVEIPMSNIKWGGSKLKKYLQTNTTIRVRKNKKGNWAITQAPEVEGAFVSMNPKNGAVLSLVGGFEFNENKFNRAIQAKRQPGSGFKPIIYTSALEQGYTAASVLNDAPISIFDPSIGKMWKPENANKKFSGPTSIRKALTYSRNIIAIQLLKGVGIGKAIETGKRFGFTEEQMPWAWSLALGSGYATPVQMARMFSVYANGGFLVDPYFIDKIETNEGEVIFQANPKVACPNCKKNDEGKHNLAPRIISPGINFIMNSMLRDVVRMGTATDARALSRSDVAGKTGTTNDQRDAWFNGFTPSHVASAWVGFDDFKPLGHYETGGVAALPMWIEYMRTALKGVPVETFKVPNDVYKKGGEYIQKGVTLKKLSTFPTMALPEEQKKKAKAKAAAKKAQKEKTIKEKPMEALF